MKIAIIGCGSMGKWFARKWLREHPLRVFDRNPESLSGLPKTVRTDDLGAIIEFAPDLLLNAVSIRHTEEVFRAVIALLPSSCMLADITSIKGNLPAFYHDCRLPFVSLHPMFGPSSLRNRRIEENLIIIRESADSGKALFREFSLRHRLRVWEYSFVEHDEMMAYSLTLPFAATISFAACVNGSEVPGSTFSQHVEIARRLLAEDEQLLSEILFNPHSVSRLEKICQNMEFLKHVIRARDNEEVHKLLKRLRSNMGAHLE